MTASALDPFQRGNNFNVATFISDISLNDNYNKVTRVCVKYTITIKVTTSDCVILQLHNMAGQGYS